MGDLTRGPCGGGAALLGIVCGMQSEVRALGEAARRPTVRIAVSGACPDRAEAEARRLIGNGAQGVLSFGLAGALDPGLTSGTLLCPATVRDETGREWPLRVPYLPAGARSGAILGVDRLVATPLDKARVAMTTRTVAVDMESHRVARIAAEAGVPAFVLRAISDDASSALPDLAARAIGADGRVRLGAVVGGLIRRPQDLPDLLAAGRDSKRALAALSVVAPRVVTALLASLAADGTGQAK